MTPKQRLLAAIKGKEVDRIPWSPFLTYFWEVQPKHIQDKGMLQFYEEIGADPMFRGYTMYEPVYKNCNVHEKIVNNEKYITFETPLGNLYEKHVFTPNTNTWFPIEHPVKSEDDFKLLIYLYENMSLKPCFEKFNEDYKELGERGLYIPVIGGIYCKTAFQSLIERWVGTEELVYALTDYPEVVEVCIHAMMRIGILSAELCAGSLAEAFIFWEDSSTTNISPSYFEKYSAPEIEQYAKIMHQNGKLLIHHACGHIKALVPLMAKTGIDMIESVSLPPTGNIYPWEVKNMLRDNVSNVSIAGGIEPTFFLGSTIEQLEEYVRELINKMGKRNFILSNADSCPPGVELEKFKLVGNIVR